MLQAQVGFQTDEFEELRKRLFEEARRKSIEDVVLDGHTMELIYGGKSPGRKVDLTETIGQAFKDYERKRELEWCANKILGEEEKFHVAKNTAEKIAGKLHEIGKHKLGVKLTHCFSCGRIDLYENGKRFQPNLWTIPGFEENKRLFVGACGHRKLCPFHAKSETKRRLRKYFDPILHSAKQNRLQFVTLTVPNPGIGELEDAVEKLWADFTKLRRRKV